MSNDVTSFFKVLGAIVIPGGFIIGTIYLGKHLYDLKNVCYNIAGFKIKNISGGAVDLEITLEVKNPSGVTVKIKGYDIDIAINGTAIASVKNSAEKVLEAYAVSYLSVPIKMSYDKFVNKVKWDEILAYFISGKTDKIFVNLNGKFLGEVAKIPVSTGIKLDYSLAEIQHLVKSPSKPCVTGKVKRNKNIS